ncbi:MAG: SPOR domain-containing protein [Raineya sp.]|jgi:hypothetical protein|nr:SPOR domain-containing protein [Raineya sp.]
MKKLILFLFLFCVFNISFAQKKFTDNLAPFRPQYEYKKTAIKSVVYLSTEKDAAPKRYITRRLNDFLDGKQSNRITVVDGYRIMLVSSRDRKTIEEAKARASQIFKNEEVKLVYEQPFYRVKMGKFINKQDADEAKRQARKHFEEAIVVPEKIKIFQNFDDEE